MRSTLTDRDAFDRCAAVFTRFSFAVVHPKIVLEFSATVDPVDGRAVAADAFLQYVADRVMQTFSLFRRDRA